MKFAPVLILLVAYYLAVYAVCVFALYADVDLGRWSRHSTSFIDSYILADPFFWTLTLGFCGAAIVFLYISTAHVGYRDSGRTFGELLGMLRNAANDLHIQRYRNPEFEKTVLPKLKPVDFYEKTMDLLARLPDDLFHRFSRNEHYDEKETTDLFFWRIPVPKEHPQCLIYASEKMLSDYIYESAPMQNLHHALKQIREQIGHVESVRGVPPNDALYRLFIWVGIILGVCIPYLIAKYGWLYGTISNFVFLGTILLIVYTAHVVGPIFDRSAQAYYHFMDECKNTRNHIARLDSDWIDMDKTDIESKEQKKYSEKKYNDGKSTRKKRDDYSDLQRTTDEAYI